MVKLDLISEWDSGLKTTRGLSWDEGKAVGESLLGREGGVLLSLSGWMLAGLGKKSHFNDAIKAGEGGTAPGRTWHVP